MARRRGNPIEDFINTAGAWLGGNRRIESPAVTRGRQAIQQTLGALDTATGGFGQAAVNDARRLSSGAGYVPSQTIKTASVNLAAAAAGYGAAKVVGKAIETGRVVNPAAAVRNAVKGEKIVVHGTSAKIQGSQLVPKSGSRGAKDIGKPVVFAHNPRAVGASKNLHRQTLAYANKDAGYNNYGQIIIGSAKKDDLKNFGKVLDEIKTGGVTPGNAETKKYLYSEKPIEIKKAIQPVQKTYPGTSKTYTTFDPKTLERELRKQGVVLRRPSIAEQAEDARKIASRKIQQIKNRRRFKDDSDF